jgi:hypothetical protein
MVKYPQVKKKIEELRSELSKRNGGAKIRVHHTRFEKPTAIVINPIGTNSDPLDEPPSVNGAYFIVEKISRSDERNMIRHNEFSTPETRNAGPFVWAKRAQAITEAHTIINGVEYFGFSICSEKDSFSGDLGQIKALADLIRVLKHVDFRNGSDPNHKKLW